MSAAETSLPTYTAKQRKPRNIDWYRTKISTEDFKALHQRSDAKAFFQTVGYLAILVTMGVGAIMCQQRGMWWAMGAFIFGYGTVNAFMINAVHELGHGTVFKTKWLNAAFCHLFAFLGWINHETFQTSHLRHHRYTLHAPDDLEVTLPMRAMIMHVFKIGIIHFAAIRDGIKNTIRIARGGFAGDWELTLYPPEEIEKRMVPVRWARILLAGHALIVIVSLAFGQWLLPILVTFGAFYGSWLHFLCNNTQHIGLQDNVPDFRLCCRTFTLNPIVRFLYWQMNYHTEHHMYAAVPCYNLGRLHELIRHDLPPVPKGLVGVWKEILTIQAHQDKDPTYVHPIQLPTPAAV
ncbi:MAG TPA: fatty acid desaturase [Chthoniobacterales bacterium]|jgi:fatty acid desaturase